MRRDVDRQRKRRGARPDVDEHAGIDSSLRNDARGSATAAHPGPAGARREVPPATRAAGATPSRREQEAEVTDFTAVIDWLLNSSRTLGR